MASRQAKCSRSSALTGVNTGSSALLRSGIRVFWIGSLPVRRRVTSSPPSSKLPILYDALCVVSGRRQARLQRPQPSEAGGAGSCAVVDLAEIREIDFPLLGKPPA